jgi:hypothetical protein
METVVLRVSGPILNQAMRRRKDEARLQGYQNSLRRAGFLQNTAKTKDPSGGTTGRVKPYGRLGWMGARAKYSLDGEG